MQMLKKWGPGVLVLVAAALAQLKKPVPRTQPGLNRLIYEKFSFHYDSLGKMDASTIETYSVMLGNKVARRIKKPAQLTPESLFFEEHFISSTIVRRIKPDSVRKTSLYDNPDLFYAISKNEKLVKPAGEKHFSAVELPGFCRINNLTCRKINLQSDSVNYTYYITNALDVKDKSGSNFLLPYSEFLGDKYEWLCTKITNRFIARADCTNKQNQIMETVRLKGMDTGVVDTGYFKVPAYYKRFASEAKAVHALIIKSISRPLGAKPTVKLKQEPNY
ncbi:MAG TPA: hypothetical protein VD905_22165 [Flavobacteriales bacterium]|nr:hypothetical protein [Flavobacteriales bacterium]